MFSSLKQCFSFRGPFAPVGQWHGFGVSEAQRSTPRTEEHTQDKEGPGIPKAVPAPLQITITHAQPFLGKTVIAIILDLPPSVTWGTGHTQFRDLYVFFNQGEDRKFHLLARAEPGVPVLSTFLALFLVILDVVTIEGQSHLSVFVASPSAFDCSVWASPLMSLL